MRYDGTVRIKARACSDVHHRGKSSHIHCANQLCCWGPAGKREPCTFTPHMKTIRLWEFRSEGQRG